MKQITFTILLLLSTLFSFSQEQSTASPCRENWKYLKTKSEIKGELIYFLPVSGCGYLISATLSIIKTENGNLIRVLQVCDNTQKIAPHIKVTLLPNYKLKDYASMLPIDKINDCKVINTYYGTLKYQ